MLLGVPFGTVGYPARVGGTVGYRSGRGYPGVLFGTMGYPVWAWGAVWYCGVPRLGRGYPGVPFGTVQYPVWAGGTPFSAARLNGMGSPTLCLSPSKGSACFLPPG